jgi:iron complex outermembrane recepter protein
LDRGELRQNDRLQPVFVKKAIAGSAFDAALFVTNATDEEITTYVPGFWNGLGAEMRVVGEPRMWGARIKYNFGR